MPHRTRTFEATDFSADHTSAPSVLPVTSRCRFGSGWNATHRTAAPFAPDTLTCRSGRASPEGRSWPTAHHLMVASAPPLTRVWPVGSNATQVAPPGWASSRTAAADSGTVGTNGRMYGARSRARLRVLWAVSRIEPGNCQSRTDPSAPAEAIARPLGANASPRTAPSCPSSTAAVHPVRGSHTRIGPSAPPVATSAPSGE